MAEQRRKKGTEGLLRLQKYLSDAGVASRRHAEELIIAGRVLVNEVVVDTLPAFIDPQKDAIVVDGRRVRPQRLEYFILNKPKGYICTNRDPAGRPRAVDLLPPMRERLVPVGRLDVDSTGLLILTNDGELAQRLSHPRYGVEKLYRVEVRGQVEADLPARMSKGVWLSDGKASATGVEVVHAARERSVLMIKLEEGRNRQVRRMFARLGHPVKTLKRVRIGPLELKGLPVGACRRLSPFELEQLRGNVPAAPDRNKRTSGKRKAKHAAPAGGGGRGRPAPGRPKKPGRTSTAPAARGGKPRKPAREQAKAEPKRRLIT